MHGHGATIGRSGGIPLAAMALAAAGLMLAGCPAPAYDATMLKQAAEMGENEQRWDEARPLIQAHLLKYPDDPLAHYYYGLSFLHLASPQLTLAEGELLTAQSLLSQNQALPEGALEEELDVFMGKLYQKTALVYIRAFREAIIRDVPYEYSRDLLKKALAQTELGLKANPAYHPLQEYLDFLKETLKNTPERTPDIMTRAAETGGSV